ncbi:hypothetical protein A0H81_02557 [Grifola frondosa]|uniref:FAD dependent oxidoreductase domain-containing protein n=1 Tax=Grifola frondosa TaxID=5627 RepID=A0A1C7MLM7_GRIFR|nr:hypothetical protein A0H81_02557 [Grifola frondosa]
MSGTYDVVVIGGGPMGLATAYECAKANKLKVLVLEKSVFFNQSGSAGDLVRMFRTAYTEDFMATLAYQSRPLWDDLEAAAGTPLRHMTGLLNFGDPNYGEGTPEGTLKGPIPNLKKYGLKYTMLTKDDIETQYPFQNLPDRWEGIDMPDNGTINVSLLMRSLFRLCEKLGVDLVQYAAVQAIRPDQSDLSSWFVEGLQSTDKGDTLAPKHFSFKTHKVAITCGAFVNHVLYPSFGFTLDVDIWEMVYQYYSIDPKVSFPKMWFHFANDTPPVSGGKPISNLFYGFPSVSWGPPNLARIAVDTATQVIKDPVDRSHSNIAEQDLENTRQWVAKHIVGISPDPVPVFIGEILQTNVYDNMTREEHRSVYGGLGHEIRATYRTDFEAAFGGWGTNEFDISQFKMDRGGGQIIHMGAVDRMRDLASGRIGSSLRR